jgi:hypothetical protein
MVGVDSGAGQEVVVVPVAPGPVRPMPGRRPRDDLDQLADELLGGDDAQSPRVVDAALVGGGAGLGGWAVVAGGRGWVLGVAGLLVLLGGAIPAQWLWRRATAGRLRRSEAKARAGGFALVVDGPEVRGLVVAHQRVLTASPAVSVRAGAHAALVEVAMALAGQPASDPASRRFVQERAVAVGALADALHDLPVIRRNQLLEARREVVVAGGFDALAVVDELLKEVRSGGDHA